ncbi:hypothetical protein OOZ19_01025 [Saccharopolyspora sp. NFXS83]|uniref:hypothetical protein n=1 Tax=Saccharopolyspora sp. NFXS83 TaxID=2993560 RepID=UPI00224AEB84|nr:hypothetical protein [Saccharopolyspora sp. NFXS83]MCX2728811.1 hypothetical protein [Saccharopolyspora sp. NFXS83]
MLVRLFRFVSPSVRVAFRVLRVVALPITLLIALSLASGLVRTAALFAFAVVALLRGAILAVDYLAERVPAPRLGWEVAR